MFDEEIIPLPLDIFRLIRDFIKDYCGIYFSDNSLFILERRLNRRIKLYSLKDFREYYRFLMYDRRRDEELQAIIDILTVNETYFFRYDSQLTAFIDEIIPELKERNKDKKKISIWSAGCATGEEPYTFAMLILEKGEFEGWDIKILGSDISRRALQVARNGVYRKNSLRTTTDFFVRKYFHQEGDGYRISDAVKKLVDFNFANLFDPFKVRAIWKMDVIFCRNVLIYFDDTARKKVIDNFFNILEEGGYLLLGHTESLINLTTAYSLKHLKNDMVYQKPFTSGLPDNDMEEMLARFKSSRQR